MWSVKGKNALVTGAGSGIGKALALELAKRGANVGVTDVAAQRIESLVPELAALGVKARAYVSDQGDKDAVAALHEDYIRDFGRADVLCANAGVAAGGSVQDLLDEDWERTLAVNLWGPIHLVRRFLPQMIENRSGGILITASIAGLAAIPGLAPYNTSKFAMVGFAETLHCELARYGIHVCALCPGIINTNIVAESTARLDGNPGVHDRMVKFYATWGADPAKVAKDGLKGLAKNRCVQPSPMHGRAMALGKRFFPGTWLRLSKLGWKKGLAV
ncbi:MAG: SDR family oxidoreductase [Deltaproteobacteria bacterium]|nr:SDR family oxidoreductase [Deltaproteobacteria bacterium]